MARDRWVGGTGQVGWWHGTWWHGTGGLVARDRWVGDREGPLEGWGEGEGGSCPHVHRPCRVRGDHVCTGQVESGGLMHAYA